MEALRRLLCDSCALGKQQEGSTKHGGWSARVARLGTGLGLSFFATLILAIGCLSKTLGPLADTVGAVEARGGDTARIALDSRPALVSK